MQAYGPSFAHIYNLRWGEFANQVAPRIREFYEKSTPELARRNLLDLCCGTGQLALHFLAHGYQVTGIDLSEAMLEIARQNTQRYLEAGEAEFILSDAASFHLDRGYDLVVSTFDSLNHLPDLAALEGCFRSVYGVLAKGGLFIFDINTRTGLARWNNIVVEETDDLALITRGVYDGESERAYMRISGFVRNPDGLFERFEETVYNTVYNTQDVKEALSRAGWTVIHPARIQDLGTPLANPESEGRVFFVAWK